MGVMDIYGDGWKVMYGSCLDRLPELADESVDAVVCDPPYELGFMGKSWDSSGIAYDVNVWRECLRVLKPGGHLLAFSGSRTYHRMTVAIEDAGFEVRDMIAWISNKTFPKSLDVSKAIDKQRKDNGDWQTVGAWLKEKREAAGFTRKTLAPLLDGHKNDESAAANVSNWENGLSFPTWERWEKLRSLIGFDNSIDAEVWRLNGRKGQPGEAWAEREVIGQRTGAQADSTGKFGGWGNDDGMGKSAFDVTAPATPEAVKWQGWGTALKPTVEPIVMARKPLIGTVAENVLAYGTGGLNIDGTRIGTEQVEAGNAGRKTGHKTGTFQLGFGVSESRQTSQGRWPSNVMLDEFTAALLDEQSGERVSGGGAKGVMGGIFGNGNENPNRANSLYFDKGGASRFFYVAKASKRDRNEGLDEKANIHPTVKPTDLMRQLIRLVTPPGGTVLDPFTGSGSTGKAAILEGMQFIGCELTEEYLPIIQGRIDWANDQVSKLADAENEKLF